jgi:hypothetical protein
MKGARILDRDIPVDRSTDATTGKVVMAVWQPPAPQSPGQKPSQKPLTAIQD